MCQMISRFHVMNHSGSFCTARVLFLINGMQYYLLPDRREKKNSLMSNWQKFAQFKTFKSPYPMLYLYGENPHWLVKMSIPLRVYEHTSPLRRSNLWVLLPRKFIIIIILKVPSLRLASGLC